MRIKNWTQYQHYKDRRPPWIKLYRELIDDLDYHALAPRAAKALPLIWLIGSESGGDLPPVDRLAFRLRMSEKDCAAVCAELSHWLEHDASNVLATCYRRSEPLAQHAIPETETEIEGETETETETYLHGVLSATERVAVETPKPEPTGNAGELKARISKLFGRRETTEWSQKEQTALRQIAKRPGVLDEMHDLERVYPTYQYRRRDILTLLNNWTTELDRIGQTFQPADAEKDYSLGNEEQDIKSA